MNDENQIVQSVDSEKSCAVEVSSDDRNLATLSHLLGIFTSFIGPAILWISFKKRNSFFITENAREAMNFQVTMAVCYIIASVLNFVLIGFLFFPVLFIYSIFVTVKAIQNTRNGITYHYPFSFKIFL